MEAHTVHQFFLQLMIILLTTRLLGELVTRLQSPAVVGERLAGVILGPSLLAWLESSQVVKLLAESGSILQSF
ncbi:hypothetical protein A1355_15630 [Methylomonas koyamae]|uniref:Cation/H+ exchanger domain-containing protein n=1 Tax=Methylomonas koyamae TaxID=702114 RepID=A0A177N395_9GAMM|nr:hypothetical protein A1355_15630 [Methylomonas koyamae]